MKQTLRWILITILIFHIGLTGLSIYSFFIASNELTRFQFYPLSLLAYTAVWFGIYLRKRFFVYFYFLLSIIELAFKVLPLSANWKNVLGDVLFPANLIFLALVLIAWKLIFEKDEQ